MGDEWSVMASLAFCGEGEQREVLAGKYRDFQKVAQQGNELRKGKAPGATARGTCELASLSSRP
jgi:hypothetical protein